MAYKNCSFVKYIIFIYWSSNKKKKKLKIYLYIILFFEKLHMLNGFIFISSNLLDVLVYVFSMLNKNP